MASLRLPCGMLVPTRTAVQPHVSITRYGCLPQQQCRRRNVVATAPRPSRLLPSAVDGSLEASTSGRQQWDEVQLRLLWDSVTRALVKLGRRGVTERHAGHLQTLLAAHGLVKVQLNGFDGDEPATQAAAEELANLARVDLVQRKGSTLLFAQQSADKQKLLEIAEESVQKTNAWKAKRQAVRQEKQEVVAASMMKRQANASRSRKQMDRIIGNAVSSSGPLTRESLKKEWGQIARDISNEEAGMPTKSNKAPLAKQPWKRREQLQQQRGVAGPGAGRPQRPQQQSRPSP